MTTELLESKFKTKPYRHQLECLNKHGRKDIFALLAEQGTGKTWIMINNMAILWADSQCDGVLVFAPNGVHTNWTHFEFPQHMPDWVRFKAADWTPDPNRKERAALDNLHANPGSGELRILTMNWEGLQYKKAFNYAEKFCCSVRRLMIICDESDAVKNPSAHRTRALMKLKKYSHWRRIMTGTPVNNAPFDIFSQFGFLDENILETTSYYAFKAEYAEMLSAKNPLVESIADKMKNPYMRKNFPPQIVARGPGGRPKYRNLDKLSKLIDPFSFRVLKKDCLDLPQKIYKTLVFSMTKEQIAIYKKAEEECRIVFENQESAFTKLVAVGKLAQITSGYYLHPAAEEPVRIPGENRKLNLLSERVEALVALGKKVIIWVRFHVEVEDVAARLKAANISWVEYHGHITKTGRLAALEDFERGDASVFLATKAASVGLNLVASHNVFYFSQDWSLRTRLQSEDRAHRIGQTEDVTYTNIVAKGTVDEDVVWALLGKQDVADVILNKGLSLFQRS